MAGRSRSTYGLDSQTSSQHGLRHCRFENVPWTVQIRAGSKPRRRKR